MQIISIYKRASEHAQHVCLKVSVKLRILPHDACRTQISACAQHCPPPLPQTICDKMIIKKKKTTITAYL